MRCEWGGGGGRRGNHILRETGEDVLTGAAMAAQPQRWGWEERGAGHGGCVGQGPGPGGRVVQSTAPRLSEKVGGWLGIRGGGGPGRIARPAGKKTPSLLARPHAPPFAVAVARTTPLRRRRQVAVPQPPLPGRPLLGGGGDDG